VFRFKLAFWSGAAMFRLLTVDSSLVLWVWVQLVIILLRSTSLCDLSLSIACELLQEEVSVILELSDQKVQGFLVLIALKRLFVKYAHKLFGEITVRT
jgi:hypothetical protein